MSKDLSFARFFNTHKSKISSEIHQDETRKCRIIWDSWRKGTYVRKLHGELK